MWQAHCRDIATQYAGIGSERKICNVRVDGYSEENDQKTVWEHHGCFFHGCPICFKNQDTAIKGTPGETMGSLYEKTLESLSFPQERL